MFDLTRWETKLDNSLPSQGVFVHRLVPTLSSQVGLRRIVRVSLHSTFLHPSFSIDF
jgi:hypothetical protein